MCAVPSGRTCRSRVHRLSFLALRVVLNENLGHTILTLDYQTDVIPDQFVPRGILEFLYEQNQ
jgi:hypothetical protein